ncbi:MAG: ABC transporter substrate-binding protein [Micrococcales bacterium]|nr:ABC transporter substrate-binding protein [Micrococcales bacterium]
MTDIRRTRSLLAAVAITGTMVLAACGGGSDPKDPSASPSSGSQTAAGEPVSGGHATYAIPYAQSWMLPIWNVGTGIGNFCTLQSWQPLYWFGNDGAAQVNYDLSVAEEPVFSDDGKTVTIKLTDKYKWSNGSDITTRDIEFYINVLTASNDAYPQNWIGYSPDGFPYNVTNFDYTSPTEFSLTFDEAYNDVWVLYNELSQIYPFPQYAWDKTSADGEIGDWDRTPEGAKEVIDFLNERAGDLQGWTDDPLWQEVSGPYKLKAYDATTGVQDFVRNEAYTGPNPGYLDSYTLKPFESDQAEINALLAGDELDYGYLPTTSLELQSRLEDMGYTVQAWPTFGFAHLSLNHANPDVGAMIRQLYIRQAMQHLINQEAIIEGAFKGFAVQTWGPIPTAVDNAFSDPNKQELYPYNPDKARELLTSHGWDVPADGVASCAKPGTGADQCGEGIEAGAKLSLDLVYGAGAPATELTAAQLKTDFAEVGIEINLSSVPSSSIYSVLVACDLDTGENCDWQMVWTGGGWTYSAPQFAPTGESLYLTGAGSNSYSYSDPKADELIRASLQGSGVEAIQAYDAYISEQLPNLWLPWKNRQVSVISNKLQGALPQDPFAQIYPQRWWLSD